MRIGNSRVSREIQPWARATTSYGCAGAEGPEAVCQRKGHDEVALVEALIFYVFRMVVMIVTPRLTVGDVLIGRRCIEDALVVL